MNILITSAGRRVSLVRAFQKELKNSFPKASVFTTDANPKLASACIISDKYFKVPRLNKYNYIDKLLSICLKNNIKLVIPTIDTELLLLAENKKKFLEKGIQIVISSIDLIQTCRDKRKIHYFFIHKGINIAQEYDKNNLIFPLFIKPSDGSRSVDTFIINSPEDLTDYHLNNDKFMFLEYLDHLKNDEYTCDLYYGIDSKLKCVIPRKRIEVRDGEVNKGITSNNELVPYIKNHLSFIKGAKGCLTAQFFLNKETNKIVGIEINPRFGGGYPLSYRAKGNFPKWIIQEYLLHEQIDYFEDWENNLLMLRYDDEIIVSNYVE